MKLSPPVLVFFLLTSFELQAVRPWWESFDNATLNHYIERGLEAHPDPVRALSRIEAAAQKKNEILASGRPKANLTGSYRTGREKTMYTNREEGDIDPFAASARISWEIDLAGRIRSASEAAEARSRMAEADLDGVQLMLASDIAASLFRIAELKDRSKLEGAIVRDVSRMIQRSRKRLAAGLEDETGMAGLVAREQQAEHMKMMTDIRLAKELNRLKSLTGIDVDVNDLPGVTDFRIPEQPDFDATKELKGRPDVRSAWESFQAMQFDSVAAQRASLPTLAIVAAAAGEASEDGAEPWEAWVGPSVTLPLWRPDLTAMKKKTQAEARASQAEFEAISLTAMREIADSRVDRENAGHMMDHMTEAREQMEKITTVELRKYQAGLIREKQWLDSQIRQHEARAGELEWQARALLSHLSLLKALGG